MRKKMGDRLVIPQAMKPHILSICHDIPTAGHFGVERTMQKVKESFTWYIAAKKLKSMFENAKHAIGLKKR